MAGILRRESRFEDSGDHFVRHPRSRISDRNDQIPVVIQGSPNLYNARSHRVFGIREQVEQDLLELVGIRLDQGHAFPLVEFELNLPETSLALNETDQLLDQQVHVRGFFLELQLAHLHQARRELLHTFQLLPR